jgi:GntR family transcriptional regulator, transcriptional repressor for pyruvate dehydrogenase complex
VDVNAPGTQEPPRSEETSRADGIAGPSRRFNSVTRRKLSSRITQDLASEILLGHLQPGAQLPPEGQLADEFEVSRQVVREAVKHLEVIGMVVTRQGKPAAVAYPENWNEFSHELLEARRDAGQLDDMLLELLEMRRLIEIEAAALAAERATTTDLDALQKEVGRMESCLHDPAAYAARDFEFHQAILRGTRNRLLPLLGRQLRPALEFTREVSVRTGTAIPETSFAEHKRILEAIERRHPQAARDAMTEHLSWTANLTFSALQARLVTNDPQVLR